MTPPDLNQQFKYLFSLSSGPNSYMYFSHGHFPSSILWETGNRLNKQSTKYYWYRILGNNNGQMRMFESVWNPWPSSLSISESILTRKSHVRIGVRYQFHFHSPFDGKSVEISVLYPKCTGIVFFYTVKTIQDKITGCQTFFDSVEFNYSSFEQP